MPNTGPVTHWFRLAKAGDSLGGERLYQTYFHRLVTLAREHLRGVPRRAADEEDVALSAFDSFLQGAEKGRFPNLQDRHELWRLLVCITVRKAADLANHEKRQCRGEGAVLDQAALAGHGEPDGDAFFDQIASREPSPALAAQVAEQLRRLLDCLNDEHRRIARWKMDGWTNEEIAQETGYVPHTIGRKIKVIRSIWQQEGLA